MKNIVCSLLTLTLIFSMSFLSKPTIAQEPARYLNEVFQENQIKIIKNIVYSTVEIEDNKEIKLKLDLYLPQNDRIVERPLIVWIHGGGFVAGTKEAMSRRCLDYAKLGYVTCTVQYRLARIRSKDSSIDDIVNAAVDDCRNAVDWLIMKADVFKIDKNTVFVGGSSAGGVTSCHLAYDDREWSNKESVKGIISLWGGILPKSIEKGSSGTFSYEITVESTECSACIIHGEKDPIVPVQLAYDLAKKLNDAEIPCTLKIDPNAGHGVRTGTNKSYHSIETLYLYICMQ